MSKELLRAFFDAYNKLRDQGGTDAQIDRALQQLGYSLDQLQEGMAPDAPEGARLVEQASEQAYASEEAPGDTELFFRGLIDPVVLEKTWENLKKDSPDIGRSIAQGVTFGFADELEAKLRADQIVARGAAEEFAKLKKRMAEPTFADLRDAVYESELVTVRKEIIGYQERHPAPATMAELAGGFLMPGWLSAKLAAKLPVKEGQLIRNSVKRATIGATSGTVEGGLYGAGTSEEIEIGAERIPSALEGAGYGLGYGVAAAPIQPALEMIGKGVSRLGQKVKGRFSGEPPTGGDAPGGLAPSGPRKREAQERLLEASKLDLHPVEDMIKNLDEFIAEGLESQVTVAHLLKEGGMGQGLAKFSAQGSGEGMALASKTYPAIAEQFPELSRKALSPMGRRVSSPLTKDDTTAQLWPARLMHFGSRQAKPFYRNADPIMHDDPELRRQIGTLISGEGEAAKTMRKAWKQAQDNIRFYLGSGAKTHGYEATRHLYPESAPKNPNDGPMPVLFWDAFKKQLDTKLKDLKKLGQSQAQEEILGTRNLILESLRDASPDYREATRIFAGYGAMKDAFIDGAKHSKKPELSAASIQYLFKKRYKTPAEQKAFRLGYASEMHKRITLATAQSPNPQSVIGLFAEENIAKIKALFKNESTARRIIERIERLSKMDRIAKAATTGSQTTPMAQAAEFIKGGPGLVDTAIRGVQKLRLPETAALDASSLLQNKRMQDITSELGPMLHTPGAPATRRTLNDLLKEKTRIQQFGPTRSGLQGLMTPALLQPGLQSLLGFPRPPQR